jgi:hypothetical protein
MSTLDGTPETSMSQPPEPVDPGSPSPQDPQTPQTLQAAPAGPPLDRVEPLNLSRRPFLNSRPVVRVSLLLLLLGLALLLWNVVQFQRYLSESADKRAQIEQGEREVTRQRQASAELQKRLGALDLEQMNQRVEFLNEVIAERTFSWTLLLDRLAEVQPNDVRLLRLTPKVESDERRGRARRSGRNREETVARRIPLGISGEARSDEALLQFVDNLFAHPSFANPNPSRDERVDEAGNLLKFDLNVQYVPGGTPQGVVVEEIPVIEETPGTSAAPNAPGTPRNPGGNRP